MGIKKSQELSISSNINNAKYNSNDETPIASGGTEGTDDGHRYHKFTSSGTLTVQKSGIAEVFVLGGGGGAGGGVSGGGGAGGAILIKEYPLVVGSWTVSVGAGGAGGAGGTGGTAPVATSTTTISSGATATVTYQNFASTKLLNWGISTVFTAGTGNGGTYDYSSIGSTSATLTNNASASRTVTNLTYNLLNSSALF